MRCSLKNNICFVVLLLLLIFNNIVNGTGDFLPYGMSPDQYSRDYVNLSIEYDYNAITSCTSPRDCSYNGDCINNQCQCYPQWMGPYCAVLHLLPTNKEYGYQYILDNQRVSSWGGAVVQDDNGDYHMYSAEMSSFCGINVW